ncbi:MAG: hypothetical protein JSW60_08890 [Thermoplasmatales archaeon]|nr:MAG: hypothetical protein JSW60_08890 [Thermoplasmatales archaeon]
MKKEIDQKHCPICGRKFDIDDLAVHMDARGPTYSFCVCSKCKRAWEIGQLKRGSTKIERREVEYKDIDIKEYKRGEKELMRESKEFIKETREAFREGKLDSVRNSMTQKMQWKK